MKNPYKVVVNAREKALSRALEVRRREVGATRPEEDQLTVLLTELLFSERERTRAGEPPFWELYTGAALKTHRQRTVALLSVELIRMKPSPAVLRALQGV